MARFQGRQAPVELGLSALPEANSRHVCTLLLRTSMAMQGL
jgi:hypothetical protein